MYKRSECEIYNLVFKQKIFIIRIIKKAKEMTGNTKWKEIRRYRVQYFCYTFAVYGPWYVFRFIKTNFVFRFIGQQSVCFAGGWWLISTKKKRFLLVAKLELFCGCFFSTKLRVCYWMNENSLSVLFLLRLLKK